MVTWVADAVPIMYIDGSVTTPVGTADGGPVIVGATEFVIGAGTSGPNYEWNGSIAIVKIYNRALTGTEILKNYNATKGRFT
jgi:hypothetical protein